MPSRIGGIRRMYPWPPKRPGCNRMGRQLRTLPLLGVALIMFASACDPSAGKTQDMAVVNGHPITKQAYKTLLRYTLNFYEWSEPNSIYYSHPICNMQVFAKACRTIKRSLVTRMIDQEIVNQYARSHGIKLTKADRATAVAEEDALKAKIGGQLGFQAYLLKLQTSKAEFRRIEEQQILTAKVMNAVVPATLSGPQVFVQEISVPFGGPPRASAKLHSRYIAAARAKALTLLQRIRAGSSFSALAKRYSADPVSRANGGNLGWVSEVVGDKTFTRAVFKLPLNQVSLVRSSFAYLVVKVLDRRVLPYQGAALSAARQQRFLRWLHNRIKASSITRYNVPA